MAFAAVAIAFVVATAIAQVTARSIVQHARRLQLNTLPGIELLTEARSELRRLESVVLAGGRVSASNVAPIRAALQSSIQAYTSVAAYPGEKEVFESTVVPAFERLDRAVDRVIVAGTPGLSEDQLALRSAADSADIALHDLVLFASAQGRALSVEIQHTRARSLKVAAVLDAASAVLAAVAAVLAIRDVRRRLRLSETRAAELRSFAMRVAHDLMSPLAAVDLSLEQVARREPNAGTKATLQRAARALERSRDIVDGIYQFSHSGGVPPPGARATLVPALRAAAEDALAAEPGAPPALVVEHLEDCEVACSPEILYIVVANLLSNAAKFTRDAPQRRITVRSRVAPAHARVEVEDTGPGIAPGLEAAVFEPQFRAPDARHPGLGLGLATVKRYVTACGGHVGVRRAADGGAVFWFELPRVKVPSGAAAREPEGPTGRWMSWRTSS